MSRLMDPSDANAAPPLSAGRSGEEFRVPMAIVHGGVIMRLADDAAGVCAVRHVRGRAVTARADSINFLAPVFVGDLVTATAWVTAVGRTSLEVEVRVEAENLASGQVSHVATAHLVMVAIDRRGRPRAVPPLALETDEERQRAAEARVRRALRQREIALIRRGRQGRSLGFHWRPPGSPPLIIGHRGAAGHAPENTLASFARAVALGADAVECDVQLTADGVPIVLHDATLDRTTNGRGAVAQQSWPGLRALDAGAWFGEIFRGERIPTLAEVLDWARGRTRVLVEIKHGPHSGDRLPERVVATIRETATAEAVLVISFDHAAVHQAMTLAPGLLGGVLYAARPLDPVSLAWGAGATALLPHWQLVTSDDVAVAHEAGLAVAPWTVDDAETAARLFGLGVDALTSNYPERLLTARHTVSG